MNIILIKTIIIFFLLIFGINFLNPFIVSIFFSNNKKEDNNFENFKDINFLIQKGKKLNHKYCLSIKDYIIKREKPLDFEYELIFIISLIYCRIPFSISRFGDGETLIMKGERFNTNRDKWFWNNSNTKFKESLIESTRICNSQNNFIGLPCKIWSNYSNLILSFSKCNESKYISYGTLFINKNFLIFKEWILKYIETPYRWKIILVANKIIKTNISWAYKFYPIPDHIVENWNLFSESLLSSLSAEAIQNELIFFISAGPASNIIISYLLKVNKNNIYIDFGSSIEFITKGYSTRTYNNKNSPNSQQRCESFYIKNKTIIYNI